MIEVKLFGVMRLQTGISHLQVDADNVSQAITKITAQEQVSKKALKECIIMVNGRRKTGRTKLKDGDEIVFLSPAAGG